MNNGQCVTCIFNGTCTADNKRGGCREYERSNNEEFVPINPWNIVILLLLVTAFACLLIFGEPERTELYKQPLKNHAVSK